MDGNKSSCFVSHNDLPYFMQPWWKINLGASYEIKAVMVEPSLGMKVIIIVSASCCLVGKLVVYIDRTIIVPGAQKEPPTEIIPVKRTGQNVKIKLTGGNKTMQICHLVIQLKSGMCSDKKTA